MHDLVRTEEAIQLRIAQLQALREASLELRAQLDSDELPDAIVSCAARLVQADAAQLDLYIPERDELEMAASTDPPATPAESIARRGEGLSGRVLDGDVPITVSNHGQWEGRFEAEGGLAAPKSVVGVPVRWDDACLGVLKVAVKAPRTLPPDEVELLRLFAEEAALALHNARLYQATALRADHLAIVNRVSHAVSRTLNLDDLVEIVYREVAAAFEPDAFFLAIYDEEKRELNYRLQVDGGTPQPPERTPVKSGLTASVLEGGSPLLIRDFELEREHLPPAELWGTMETPASWLGVPMRVADRTVGVICVQSYRPGAYDSTGQQLLCTIADQVGIAVDNARLYEETARRLAEAQVRREFLLAATSTLDFDEVLGRTLRALRDTTGADFIAFEISDREQNTLHLHPSQIGFPREQETLPISMDGSICGRVFLTGQPMLVDDVRTVPHYFEGVAETRSELAVPVRIRGQVVGVLNVESRELNAFDEDDLDFYATIASQLGMALEKVRLFQSEREQRRQATALEEAAAAVSGTLDLDEVLDRILAQVEKVVEGDAFNVMLIEEQDVARVVRRRGYEGRDWGVQAARVARYGLLRRMIETGEPVIVPDTVADPDWIEDENQSQWRSYLGTPIKVGGVIVGFLNVNSTHSATHTDEDARRLQAFASHVATAIENARLYQELHSYADSLQARVGERTSQLRTQYAQLETILDSTADGIILAGSDGELILANPIARSWLSQMLSPQESDRLREAVRALAAKAEGRPEILLELSGLDLQLTATPVSNPEMDEARAVIAIHDVTHLKALNRMKSRFVSNVSHELRTPIATIKLLAHLMQQQPERWEEYLGPLIREADHQARLVRDILEMSRVDAGRLELRLGPTSMNHLAETAVSSHQAQAEEHGLTVTYCPGDSDTIALADSQWMTQVMNNLMSNAIRYTLEGGEITVETGVRYAEGRSWATVTVSDTGIGIPEDELPHVFDRFFRGEEPRSMQISGTGLGLAILKEIVELHGGQVTVESEVDQGSTFRVWLPLETQWQSNAPTG
jgi:signal transduction histidine kinase